MRDSSELLEPLLQTRQLCRQFRRGATCEVRAVDDVSLDVSQGNCVALIGPSGSGKTTLLSLLGLLDIPTSGEVILQGRSLRGCSDYELARVRRRMGYVFQNFSLLPKLSVMDNIVYPLIPRGIDRRQRREACQHWIDRLGLAARADARADELSGGECQRVALARALAGDPEILLADEPTSNLDPESGQVVAEILREAAAAGKTVLLATHDRELLSLTTKIYHLRGGKLVSSSP